MYGYQDPDAVADQRIAILIPQSRVQKICIHLMICPASGWTDPELEAIAGGCLQTYISRCKAGDTQ